ncbi:Bestrophin, RFP-TM, chloride channel-domain-containing protein [Daedaleopsis nitida]|nr:Bestrophin, RFP-TM, chloride channel-domain-containing protein [Daedaleopsis nitida]
MPSVSVLKTSTLTITTPKGTKIITRQKLRRYSWLPDVLRLKGSIVPRVIGPVLTVTIFATAAAYAWSRGIDISLTNSVVPLLSVVVGLILVFRTSYDRYWEGRKDFATMLSHVRNLSRLIWINVSVAPQDDAARGKFPGATLTPAQLRRRKRPLPPPNKDYRYRDIAPGPGASTNGKSTAYTSYAATEHTTRRGSPEGMGTGASTPGLEGSVEYDVERGRPSADATKRIRVKRSKDRMKGPGQKSTTPLISSLQNTIDFATDPDSLCTPLPMVIAHELSRSLFKFRRDGYLETVGPAGVNAMNTLIQGMIDMMSAMERVANTPIPRSYSIHLKQCVSLYLFSLPFTLIKDLGWGMVPLVTVVAFTLMGIEGIADEIEMPFGTDSCDLPLERYCEDLREEIE